MIGKHDQLDLAELNRITSVWAEKGYNRQPHRSTHQTPMQRLLEGPDAGRDCPDMAALKWAFCIEQERRQRRSDGTVSLGGVRFEVPSRLRHMRRLRIRHARWNLSGATVVDDNGQALCRLLPVDLQANADRRRRRIDSDGEPSSSPDAADNAPLLKQLLEEFAATGLPPPYQPHDESGQQER